MGAPSEDGVHAFSMDPALHWSSIRPAHHVNESAANPPFAADAASGSTAGIVLPPDTTPGALGGSPDNAAEHVSAIAQLHDTLSALITADPTLSTGTFRGSHDSAAQFLHVTNALLQTLDDMPSGSSKSSRSPLPPSASWKLPEFRGFQDDVDRWIEAVNILGARYAWPDHYKRLVAININGAAAAWHRYEGVSLADNNPGWNGAPGLSLFLDGFATTILSPANPTGALPRK